MKRLLTIVLILTLFLTGCGYGSNKKEIKIGKYLKKNDTIAFVTNTSVDDNDRNSYVNMVIVTKNGKMKVYNTYHRYVDDSLTLGKATKLSDKKLIKISEKLNKKVIDSWNEDPDKLFTYKNRKPTFEPIKLAGTEDGSGNKLDSEYIISNKKGELQDCKFIKEQTPFSVYDAKYAGIGDTKGAEEDGGGTLLIKVGDRNKRVTFDDVKDLDE
ncbi:hypothetical protein K4Q72_12005 [Staphylococcus epidermidis]|uniref:hypothetical protein n=1 Tax=Staphylococcus epidermidis TaxID=1282 RepID=UPI00119FA723|nr:hypothetical protein [Staphylococcus epidermidis]MCG1589769.1 hypothetical protein [Staphylococcus epidermidis]HDE6879223.1 hypothetical protein [Staphylococcus aureus]